MVNSMVMLCYTRCEEDGSGGLDDCLVGRSVKMFILLMHDCYKTHIEVGQERRQMNEVERDS